MKRDPLKEAAELAARFGRIKKLTDALAVAQADSSTQQAELERLRRELDAARRALSQVGWT